MKKIILSLGIIFTSFLTTFDSVSADNGYFVVTAYYSPLPNQAYYLKGSYEADIRLNGKGIAGASGKEVFSGMLAGPKNYEFGTKIYLDGLGVGVIEDRGGAIVNAGNRGYTSDRIDVWMGYGEEGLRRALFWGKRTVKGNIISSSTPVTLDYTDIDSPLWVANTIKYKVEESISKYVQKKDELSLFKKPLKGVSDIKRLQNLLLQIGVYNGDITGNYKDLIDPIYAYQKSNDIVKNVWTPGAGTYGPKTRKALLLDYKNYIEEQRKQDEILARKKEVEQEIKKIKVSSNKEAQLVLQGIGTPKFGEISPSVRELQKTLHTLGFFDYKDTAIFGKITQKSIINYQIKRGIIGSESDASAGYLGPQTKIAIQQDIQEIIYSDSMEKGNIDVAILENNI